MIEFHLLEALVAFAQHGTLAKAASVLGVTQPALTHSMKQLEVILGVQLFIRRPNKLLLTETGKYTVKEAEKLLTTNRQLRNKVQHFEQSQAIITVGANAPGPLIVLHSLNATNLIIKDTHIQQNFDRLLIEGQMTCLLTNQNFATDQITSIYLGTERMAVNLPSDNRLVDRDKLTYADLAGNTFLCPQEIGFWQHIYESQIPNGKFIRQDESSEYQELLNYSSLPFFTTNLTQLDTQWGAHLPTNRIAKPLADSLARQQFYISFLKRNAQRLKPFIQQLQDCWARVDE